MGSFTTKFYRHLDRNKSEALKNSKGQFDAWTHLTCESKAELDWWIENIESSFSSLITSDPQIEIKMDASTEGWGASWQAKEAGGRWSDSEQDLHINALEIMAIECALKCFEKHLINKHVKILTDNTCVVSYLREMGGSHSVKCNEIAHKIWV